jgi:hypothetical protein
MADGEYRVRSPHPPRLAAYAAIHPALKGGEKYEPSILKRIAHQNRIIPLW